MAGRRIDIRSVFDGPLLAVPSVLLLFVMPRHLVRIGLERNNELFAANIFGLDVVLFALTALYVMCVIGGFAAGRWISQAPLRVTAARLLLILLLTLFAIGLAAIDMVYVKF